MSTLDRASLWRNLRQFVQFGLVGGSGVIVNMIVVIACNQVAIHAFNSHEYDAFLRIPGTDLGLRNYLLYVIVAFFIANLFNFVLNRHWTFRQGDRAPFMKEYIPFLLVGSVAALAGLVLMQLLMNRTSPLYLGWPFLIDDSPFWFRRVYWANAIQIVIVMPINFIANKLWTFRAVREKHASGVS